MRRARYPGSSADDTRYGTRISVLSTQAFRVRLIENDPVFARQDVPWRNRIGDLRDNSHGHVACCFCRAPTSGSGHYCAPSGAIEGIERMKPCVHLAKPSVARLSRNRGGARTTVWQDALAWGDVARRSGSRHRRRDYREYAMTPSNLLAVKDAGAIRLRSLELGVPVEHRARPRPAALSSARAPLMPSGHERLTRSWRSPAIVGKPFLGWLRTR
jgi:hypothetical protein